MWNCFGKRLLDICVAGVGLIALAPFFAAVAIAVWCESGGPIFFRQRRLGRHFQPFNIIKFRTMVQNAQALGGSLTAGDHDPRITRVGRFLRKYKIDELPQLVNVFRGDMSLVGPRPEVARYAELFRDDFEYLLRVQPGITDPASLEYRDEGLLLSGAADPELEYVSRILPDKIRLSRQYIDGMSARLDLQVICRTVFRVIFSRPVAERDG